MDTVNRHMFPSWSAPKTVSHISVGSFKPPAQRIVRLTWSKCCAEQISECTMEKNMIFQFENGHRLFPIFAEIFHAQAFHTRLQLAGSILQLDTPESRRISWMRSHCLNVSKPFHRGARILRIHLQYLTAVRMWKIHTTAADAENHMVSKASAKTNRES